MARETSRPTLYDVSARTDAWTARTFLIDLTIAAVIAAGQVWITWLRTPDRSIDPVGTVLLVATALPLALRRLYPLPVLVAVVSLALLYDTVGRPPAQWTVAIVVAVYTAVAAGHRTTGIAVAAAASGAFILNNVLLGVGHFTDLESVLWFGGWLVLGLAAGEVTRSRRDYLEQVEARAFEAERTREKTARQRATEERMRIARELHDALAQRISLINVQSGVALHLLDRQPEQAREALRSITDASRNALRELRGTLGVLRAGEAEPRTPIPTLERLDELVRVAQASGIAVRLNVAGEPRPLEPSVDLAAYRIAQESLTNVARHAPRSTASLSISYGPDDLVVEVENEGIGRAAGAEPGTGHGLIGMRERAASVGGELQAGPRPEGGFRVRARLPLEHPA